MSATASSRTKTGTGSSSSDSISEYSPEADRWTHNITYRGLVTSTCIGIIQLWWHPYIHDLKKLVPFLFLYNVFSVFVGYPMFYLELALGVVTKKSVLNCWDLSPFTRGIGLSMLITGAFTALTTGVVAAWSLALCVHSFHAFLRIGLSMLITGAFTALATGVVAAWSLALCVHSFHAFLRIGLSMLITGAFTALATGVVAAWSLALFVHSFHAFLPWLHCAAAASPVCAARHRPMPPRSETPAHSFFFNYVLRLKRDGLESGFGPVVKELAIYYVICWIIIYCIAFKRIYSISKLVMFKDVLAYFVLICSVLGCVRLDGAGRMFKAADWSVLFTECQIWRDAAEFALIQMSVSQGTLIMLGSRCPRQQHALARTSLLAFAASKTTSMVTALTLGAAHGALAKDYESQTHIRNGSSASMVLWADYVARIPGSQFWSAILFFTLFVLALTSTALTIHTIMSAFTGRSIRKIAWAFLVLICALFASVGILSVCSQGGLYIVDFVMRWPASKPRVVLSAVSALIVSFAYGQSTFCEDVYFAVGEYPNVFLRVCWAVAPPLLTMTFLCDLCVWGPESSAGWALVTATLAPTMLVMLLYLVFKFRVRNIVSTEK